LLIGHGRMGRLVETLAPEYGFVVTGAITRRTSGSTWPDAEVGIDFSTADAVPATIENLAPRGTALVIGTTGWQSREQEIRGCAQRHRIGVVAAPNFAVGVNLFLALIERAGQLMSSQSGFGGWIHELHHAAKKDAPSGTALAMERALRHSGYGADVPIASTRAGSIPGTHTLGFDAASETITITHSARDRAAFARGALEAARWIQGRQGWFTMKDVLGL
jgi:4-hydroxy-tetrahydrodipicolinate reductase